MKDAQYRKSRSIAFFSSTNAAIEMMKVSMQGDERDELVRAFITEWRDWFLAEYDRDYKENVLTIGLPTEVMNGLDKAKEAYDSK